MLLPSKVLPLSSSTHVLLQLLGVGLFLHGTKLLDVQNFLPSSSH